MGAFYKLQFVRVVALAFAVIFPAAAQTKSDFDDLSAQAAAAREVNNVTRAIQLYSRAVEVNPKWSDGWWFLGSLQYANGGYNAAEVALTRYLELAPQAASALALRGLCEYETGEYQQSITDIQAGIAGGAAIDPRNAQTLRYHEGLLLTRLSRFQDALKSYAFFAEKNVDNPELMVAIGLAGLRMASLPKDVTADQEPLLAAAGNAGFEFMAGDEQGSKKSFEELFTKFPTAINAHLFLGYLLFANANEVDAALVQFQRELELSATNWNAEIMAAWTLLLSNRPAEALPYAQRAVDQQPSSVAAQLVLGRSMTEAGELKGGLQHLVQAVQLEPDNLESHIALAKAYSKSGRKDDARRERMLCLRLTQSNNAAQFASP